MNTSILIRMLMICVSLAPTALVHSESAVGIAHIPTEESQTKDPQSKCDGESDDLWHNATRTPVRAAVTSILLTAGATPLLTVCAAISRVGTLGCVAGSMISAHSGRPNIAALSAAGAVTLGVTSVAFFAGAGLTGLLGFGAGIRCIALCIR